MTSILDEYRRRVAVDELAAEEPQLGVARRLDRLSGELSGYRSPARAPRWRRLLGNANGRPPPRGLYIWGGVGRGKTMLMDLFHETAPLTRKRRVHFHRFMQEVHQELYAIRQKQRSGLVWDDANPIGLVCQAVAEKATLLCFDEFQVTDITDAMILGRLFEALFDRGVVVVATSNTPPKDLYRDGLNRNAFLPFIAMLEAKLDVVHLTGPRDYRLDGISGETLYVTPLGPAADSQVEWLWRELTTGAEERPRTLHVAGRAVEAERTAGGVARFSFAELCERPLGAGDYTRRSQLDGKDAVAIGVFEAHEMVNVPLLERLLSARDEPGHESSGVAAISAMKPSKMEPSAMVVLRKPFMSLNAPWGSSRMAGRMIDEVRPSLNALTAMMRVRPISATFSRVPPLIP